MVSKSQFYFNLCFVYAFLAIVSYPPNRAHADYTLSFLGSLLSAYHLVQALRFWFTTTIPVPNHDT